VARGVKPHGKDLSRSKRLLSSLPTTEVERVQRFRRHLVDLCDYLRQNWSGFVDAMRAGKEPKRTEFAAATGQAVAVEDSSARRIPA
jgi:hypothetical protein